MFHLYHHSWACMKIEKIIIRASNTSWADTWRPHERPCKVWFTRYGDLKCWKFDFLCRFVFLMDTNIPAAATLNRKIFYYVFNNKEWLWDLSIVFRWNKSSILQKHKNKFPRNVHYRLKVSLQCITIDQISVSRIKCADNHTSNSQN